MPFDGVELPQKQFPPWKVEPVSNQRHPDLLSGVAGGVVDQFGALSALLARSDA